ncbi:MAG: Clp protease ClpP [Synergistaceae bacterium]|nr:Clp protease ClpP [Synergistaceae bacterium]
MDWKFTGQLNNNAEILLYDIISSIHNEEIGVTNAKHFNDEIKALGNVESITVRINSIGGDVYQGIAMYHSLKMCNAKIHVIIDGIAASSASIVAMAGDKISMPENSLLMIHNPYSGFFGDVNDLQTAVEALARMQECFVGIYQSKTGLVKEKILALMNKETWLSADEAKNLHFCDEIIDAVDMVACADKNSVIVKTFTGSARMKKEIAPKNLEIKEEKNKMEEVIKTVAELEQKYPDLIAEIKAAASVNERSRIKELDDMFVDMPNADAIVKKAKYDEPRVASEVAFDVIKAFKAQSAIEMENRRNDAKDVNAAIIPTIENHDDFNAKIDAVSDEIKRIRGVK